MHLRLCIFLLFLWLMAISSLISLILFLHIWLTWLFGFSSNLDKLFDNVALRQPHITWFLEGLQFLAIFSMTYSRVFLVRFLTFITSFSYKNVVWRLLNQLVWVMRLDFPTFFAQFLHLLARMGYSCWWICLIAHLPRVTLEPIHAKKILSCISLFVNLVLILKRLVWSSTFIRLLFFSSDKLHP